MKHLFIYARLQGVQCDFLGSNLGPLKSWSVYRSVRWLRVFSMPSDDKLRATHGSSGRKASLYRWLLYKFVRRRLHPAPSPSRLPGGLGGHLHDTASPPSLRRHYDGPASISPAYLDENFVECCRDCGNPRRRLYDRRSQVPSPTPTRLDTPQSGSQISRAPNSQSDPSAGKFDCISASRTDFSSSSRPCSPLPPASLHSRARSEETSARNLQSPSYEESSGADHSDTEVYCPNSYDLFSCSINDASAPYSFNKKSTNFSATKNGGLRSHLSVSLSSVDRTSVNWEAYLETDRDLSATHGTGTNSSMYSFDPRLGKISVTQSCDTSQEFSPSGAAAENFSGSITLECLPSGVPNNLFSPYSLSTPVIVTRGLPACIISGGKPWPPDSLPDIKQPSNIQAISSCPDPHVAYHRLRKKGRAQHPPDIFTITKGTISSVDQKAIPKYPNGSLKTPISKILETDKIQVNSVQSLVSPLVNTTAAVQNCLRKWDSIGVLYGKEFLFIRRKVHERLLCILKERREKRQLKARSIDRKKRECYRNYCVRALRATAAVTSDADDDDASARPPNPRANLGVKAIRSLPLECSGPHGIHCSVTQQSFISKSLSHDAEGNVRMPPPLHLDTRGSSDHYCTREGSCECQLHHHRGIESRSEPSPPCPYHHHHRACRLHSSEEDDSDDLDNSFCCASCILPLVALCFSRGKRCNNNDYSEKSFFKR